MKFQLTFKVASWGHSLCAFEPVTLELGVEGLSWLRSTLNDKVPIEIVSGSVHKTHPRVEQTFTISEELAERSGLFAVRNKRSVTVTPGGFNRFLRPRVVIGYSDDHLVQVRIETFVDQEAVLEAWEKAGFPTEWEPEPYEIEHIVNFLALAPSKIDISISSVS